MDVREYDAHLEPELVKRERELPSRRKGERALSLTDSDRYFQIVAKQFLRERGGKLVDLQDEWLRYQRALKGLKRVVAELDFRPKTLPQSTPYPAIRPGWREAHGALLAVQKQVERIGHAFNEFHVSAPSANGKLEDTPLTWAIIRLFEMGGPDKKGYTVAEIGRILSLSSRDVRQKLRNTVKKLKRMDNAAAADVAERLTTVGRKRSKAGNGVWSND